MMFKKFLSYLRAPLLLIFLPLFTLYCSAAVIFFYVPFTSRKTTDRFIRFWGKTLCDASGIEIQLRGTERIRGLGSAVLVSNHLGLFDIPVLFSVVPMSFRMAAKAELFKIPVFGQSLKAAGFFPILRNNPDAARGTMSLLIKKFDDGESVWMAPEGTRFKGTGVGEFKLGASFLAIKAGQPVVPICIYGTQYVLPKHSFLINWGRWKAKVVVEILDPVHPRTAQEPEESTNRHKMRDFVRGQIVSAFDGLHNSNGSPHLEMTE